MDGTTMIDLSPLLDYGVLGIFATVVVYYGVKAAKYVGHKFLNETNGFVPQYMRSQQKFFDGLAERDVMQQELCNKHATTLGMVESVVSSNSERNAIEIESLQQIKTAGREHCKMCRKLVHEHLPSSVPAIESHLNKIEELLK